MKWGNPLMILLGVSVLLNCLLFAWIYNKSEWYKNVVSRFQTYLAELDKTNAFIKTENKKLREKIKILTSKKSLT